MNRLILFMVVYLILYRLSKNNKQFNKCRKVVFEAMMFLVMRDGVMGTSQDNYLDGTPCAMKVACTVWSRGKARDNIKSLPIAIVNSSNFTTIAESLW